MRFGKTTGAVVLMGALLVALSGCQKEGPMERAGKEADQAIDKTGQQIEKAGDAIQDASQGDKN